MNKAMNEIKQRPSYRYLKELCAIFEKAGIEEEPIEIPLQALMQAPVPPYLPVPQAVTCKVLFIMAITQPRHGGLMDALPGFQNMMQVAAEDR